MLTSLRSYQSPHHHLGTLGDFPINHLFGLAPRCFKILGGERDHGPLFLGGHLCCPSQRWYSGYMAKCFADGNGRFESSETSGGLTLCICCPKTGWHGESLGSPSLWRRSMLHSEAASGAGAVCLLGSLRGLASRWVRVDLGGCSLWWRWQPIGSATV